jgi:hypothetical protein
VGYKIVIRFRDIPPVIFRVWYWGKTSTLDAKWRIWIRQCVRERRGDEEGVFNTLGKEWVEKMGCAPQEVEG